MPKKFAVIWPTLLCTLLLLPFYSKVAATTVIPETDELWLSPQLTWHKDAVPGWGPHKALEQLKKTPPITGERNWPSLGLQPQPIWFYTPINYQAAPQQWLLQAGRPHMDRLDFFLFDDAGTLIQQARSGSSIPWSQRPFPSTTPTLPIKLVDKGKYHLLLRAQAIGAMEMPLAIYSQKGFTEQRTAIDRTNGIYYGVVIAMILFNTLLFVLIRDRAYFFYVLYLSSLFLFLITRHGITLQLFWPETPSADSSFRIAFGAASFALALCFAKHFLYLSETHPRLARLSTILALFMLTLSVSAFIDTRLSLIMLTFTAPWYTAYPLILAIIRMREGFKPALYFIISFIPIAFFVFLFLLKTLSIIKQNSLLQYSVEIGSTLESMLLAVALSYRFTQLKSENNRINKEAKEKLEQRVQERTKELHQALSSRNEFLSIMGHEVRTPLNGILGTIDILKDSELKAEQRRKLNIIERCGNDLLSLTNDVLDYARLDSGKLPIKEQHFNLPGLIKEAVSLHEEHANIKGNSIKLNLSNNIGTGCYGDPIRLRQILTNLITNAIKFTENGTITINAKREIDNLNYIILEVSDSGSGISATEAPYLFERFRQGHNHSPQAQSGAGLGLAICKQLTDLMNGEISVSSQKGCGSQFFLTLPMPEKIPSMSDAESTQASQEIQEERHLLIVDDNHVNLLVAQGLAEKLGHKVEVAGSGAEAIAVLLNDSRVFDLILMDCEMPGMNGFETSKEIRRLQKEGRITPAPIVALTAHATPEKVLACTEAGMVGHIPKPINSQKLAAALATMFTEIEENTLNSTE